MRRTNRRNFQQYVQQYVEDDTSNNLWRLIKSRRSDSMGVAPLKKNGLTYSDSRTKADLLNDQFCSAFTREDLAVLLSLDASPHPDMPDIQVSTKGVQKLLANLNPRKAAGPTTSHVDS